MLTETQIADIDDRVTIIHKQTDEIHAEYRSLKSSIMYGNFEVQICQWKFLVNLSYSYEYAIVCSVAQ